MALFDRSRRERGGDRTFRQSTSGGARADEVITPEIPGGARGRETVDSSNTNTTTNKTQQKAQAGGAGESVVLRTFLGNQRNALGFQVREKRRIATKQASG